MTGIRAETGSDIAGIDRLLRACFEGSDEAALVAALRDAGDLSLSLVAEEAGRIVGHVGFSPLTIESHPDARYHALAPLAVARGWRRRGIGAQLAGAGLERLAAAGADGAVVLGDPAYYQRFGFRADAAEKLVCPWSGPYLQVLRFGDVAHAPAGKLGYARAFGA
ncbi:MAG: GNAT family N-acetyltransferase [Paracoccaceae bacterium]